MQIEHGKSLKSLNTFGVDALAKYFSEIRSPEEFLEMTCDKRFFNEKKLILGGGSNILLMGDFDGLVVRNSIPGITVTGRTGTEVTVKAGAGVVWHDLVLWSLDRNYAGLENLSLIPGLTGAAPIQNIGAYGAEVKDVFHELEAIEISSGKCVKFGTKDCAFGYRDSIFKQKLKDQFLILSVSFKLTDLSAPRAAYQYRTEYGDLRKKLDEMKTRDLSLNIVSDAICQIRRAKLPDPRELGNAGSFFKNPSLSKLQSKVLAEKYPGMPHFPQTDGTVKIPAGWLIEQCGWKGKRAGRAGCHKAQALVLVNYGDAKGQEILDLAFAIRESVREQFEIELSLEVNVI
jgi:UDP-N-acetylmuramate dehydrogenase